MTTPRISIERQRTLLSDLARLVMERSRDESGIRTSFEGRDAASKKHCEDASKSLREHYEQEKERLSTEYTQALNAVMDEFEKDHAAVTREYERCVAQVKDEGATKLAAANKQRQSARRKAERSFEVEKHGLPLALQEFEQGCQRREAELRSLEVQIRGILRRRWCRLDEQPPPPRPAATSAASSAEASSTTGPAWQRSTLTSNN